MGVSIGFGKSKSSESGESTTSGTNRVTGTTKTVQELLAGDEGAKSALDDIMNTLLGNAKQKLAPGAVEPGYTKADAIADSEGLVASIFGNYSRTQLPQIFSAQGSAGAYNSTGAQALANDAFSEATSKSQAAVLGNIKTYADITAQMKAQGTQESESALTALLGSLGLQQSAVKKQTGEEEVDQLNTFNTKTKSFGTARGSQMNLGANFQGPA
jgi:hypothetical protein